MGKHSTVEEAIKKGPWTPEEDEVLINFVNKYGPRNWSSIRFMGLLPRTGKSCRLRWVNKLRPNLKIGCKFSAEEEGLLTELQERFGNKWAKIASHFPGRTDNDVKNFWSTRQKRLARILQSSPLPLGSKSQKNKGKAHAVHELLQEADEFSYPKMREEPSPKSQSQSMGNPDQMLQIMPLPDWIIIPNLINLDPNLPSLDYPSADEFSSPKMREEPSPKSQSCPSSSMGDPDQMLQIMSLPDWIIAPNLINLDPNLPSLDYSSADEFSSTKMREGPSPKSQSCSSSSMGDSDQMLQIMPLPDWIIIPNLINLDPNLPSLDYSSADEFSSPKISQPCPSSSMGDPDKMLQIMPLPDWINTPNLINLDPNLPSLDYSSADEFSSPKMREEPSPKSQSCPSSSVGDPDKMLQIMPLPDWIITPNWINLDPNLTSLDYSSTDESSSPKISQSCPSSSMGDPDQMLQIMPLPDWINTPNLINLDPNLPSLDYSSTDEFSSPKVREEPSPKSQSCPSSSMGDPDQMLQIMPLPDWIISPNLINLDPNLPSLDYSSADEFSSPKISQFCLSSSMGDPDQMLQIMPLSDWIITPNLINLDPNLPALDYSSTVTYDDIKPSSETPLHLFFPQLRNPKLDLPLLSPENYDPSLELAAAADFLDSFAIRRDAELEIVSQLNLGSPFLGELEGAVAERDCGGGDNEKLRTPDSFFDELPDDIFDYLEEIPGSSPLRM